MNIQIPEGYKVESLPKKEAYTFNDDHASFKYVITNGGNLIRVNFSFIINNPLILPFDYSIFKEFYNKMIEKHAEQVILTKA